LIILSSDLKRDSKSENLELLKAWLLRIVLFNKVLLSLTFKSKREISVLILEVLLLILEVKSEFKSVKSEVKLVI